MPLSRVLVVDDDKLIGWALRRELSARDIGVHVVVTAEDALQELRGARRFDFIFLDVNLPDGDGLDRLEEIRSAAPETKIIVISAEASEANRRRALEGGALQFLEKPFDMSELHGILRSASAEFTRERRFARYHCRVPMQISVVDSPRQEDDLDLDNLRGLMADVGPGGMRLRTDYPLKVGQVVRPRPAEKTDYFLRFVPPQALAEVVWVSPSDQEVTAGLRFLA